MTIVHLIYAHPNPDSYNAALKRELSNQLQKANHTVLISDLYADSAELQSFYGQPVTAKQRNYIADEQQKIKSSSLTIVQFPLYWFSVPAILKNYFDLIYAHGFAYPGKFSDSPLHDGRKVMFSITTQSNQQDFSATGCNGSIERTLYPLELAFRFVGYQIVPAEIHYAVASATPVERQQQMQHFNEKVLAETSMPY
jgi:NAD(P)H dehydrogenase (quinone)